MTITQFSLQINKKPIARTKKFANQIIQQTFDVIGSQFSKREINDLAWETGLIKRSSAKIGGYDFLASLLVASLDPAHSSLERICEIITRINRSTRITAQAVMAKINTEDSVNFLKSVFSNILSKKAAEFTEVYKVPLRFFSKVLIQDSSVIQLNGKLQKHFKGSGGRASSSFAKLDVIYDYKSKDFERIKLTDQGEADQKLSLEIEGSLVENALVIRDLGYLRLDGLEQIQSKKAFFLSRYKLNLNLYESCDDDSEIDLVEYVEKHGINGVLDMQVYLTDKKIPVRLIASKAPEEVVNKRRRIVRATAKKQGRSLTEKTLKLMSLTIFLTNVPKEIWKAEMAFTIYKIRWQIELIFKC